MNKLFELSQVALKGHTLSFTVNGTPVICDLFEISEVLAHAGTEQVARMIVDPVGVGFHWPELDEDLSVSGILKAAGIQVDPTICSTNQSERAFRFDEECETVSLS